MSKSLIREQALEALKGDDAFVLVTLRDKESTMVSDLSSVPYDKLGYALNQAINEFKDLQESTGSKVLPPEHEEAVRKLQAIALINPNMEESLNEVIKLINDG